MSRIHLSFGALLALGIAAPLAAQETPAPPAERVLPPIRYSLPPGEGAPQPAPAQPVVTPPPIVVPPTPAPRPTATPTPRATASATPRPVPTPRATPAVEATAAPVAAEPAPTVVEAPAEPVATPSPEAPAAAPVEPASGSIWPWLLAGLALLVAGVGFFWWRRRTAATPPSFVEVEPAPPVAAPPPAPTPPRPLADPTSPVIAPPSAPSEPDAPQFLSRPAGPPLPPRAPLPAGTITAFRDRPKPADTGFITAFCQPAPTLGIEVQPIRAGTDPEIGFVELQFAFVNASDQGVSDMLVSAWLLSANPDQDAQIAAYLAEPSDPAQHNRYSLQPGEHREHRATMGAPLDQFHIVEAGGRRFFAPILLVDARYRGQGGAEGRSTAAFVIGRPNSTTGKLLPVYVDRGPRAVEGLTARPYPIGRPQAA